MTNGTRPDERADLDCWDVVIIGGGPAGLAVAIVAAERGLSTLVLEKREAPPDKACGEGLLPPGVCALERLGIDMSSFRPGGVRRFSGIRFLQEDGATVEAPLPGGGGLGIRRTALVEALGRRAREFGAIVLHRCAVHGIDRTASAAHVRSTAGTVSARLVVAADGLHSPIRRAAGLAREPARRRRFALRQHFRVRPWTDFVEVYVDAHGEAVVTPVSESSVNVNFVWEQGHVEAPSIATLAARFPALLARLADAPAMSSLRGAGPMACGALRRTQDRLVLVGDAAGFVDSIAADGLSVAFNSALLLGEVLPEVLARGCTQESLAGYERAARRLFRSYWLVTSALLWIARHPPVRRGLVRYLARHRAACDTMMHGAMRLMMSPVSTP